MGIAPEYMEIASTTLGPHDLGEMFECSSEVEVDSGLYHILAFFPDFPIKIREGILKVLNMIKLVHVHRVIDCVVGRKALVGNVCCLAVTRRITFEQIDEELELPTHDYAIFK